MASVNGPVEEAATDQLSSWASVRPKFALDADMGGSNTTASDPGDQLIPPSAAFRERALVESRAQVSLSIAAHCFLIRKKQNFGARYSNQSRSLLKGLKR